jgi:mono/diheme cytochrome c family protein
MTRQPVRAQPRENQLSFPLNQRAVVAGWKLLYLRHGTYQPDATKSAEWNRGAYLVEGLAHCGACHTPRNSLGAERTRAAFAGGDVDNWHAYAINSQSPAPVPWNADALFQYLRQGWHPDHGVARGPMAEVVSNLSEVPESDVRRTPNAVATMCWRRPGHDKCRRLRPATPARRSTLLPARPAMAATAARPMAASISH